jgi:hypothetical protein
MGLPAEIRDLTDSESGRRVGCSSGSVVVDAGRIEGTSVAMSTGAMPVRRCWGQNPIHRLSVRRLKPAAVKAQIPPSRDQRVYGGIRGIYRQCPSAIPWDRGPSRLATIHAVSWNSGGARRPALPGMPPSPAVVGTDPEATMALSRNGRGSFSGLARRRERVRTEATGRPYRAVRP